MWKGLFWTATLGILVLSLLPPGADLPSTGWDKANHLLGFSTLAVLALAAYPARRTWPRLAGLALMLLGFGALVEILQALTPYRSAEWGDLLADALGIALGIGAFRLARAID